MLRAFRYGDTSKIVSLYTRRFGKMKVIAKGARSKSPRFGASLEPFTESLVVFYRKRERELQLLSSSDTMHSFPRLRDRAARLGLACATVEALERLTAADEEDAALYALVRGALAALEAAGDDAAAEVAFWRAQKALLAHLGYRWEIESCVGCGEPVYGARVAFDPLEGTLCASCARAHGGAATLGAAARAALADDFPAPLAAADLSEVRRVFSLFYERCGFGRGPLRSLAYVAAVGGAAISDETEDAT